jgi:hypothetical protein
MIRPAPRFSPTPHPPPVFFKALWLVLQSKPAKRKYIDVVVNPTVSFGEAIAGRSQYGGSAVQRSRKRTQNI